VNERRAASKRWQFGNRLPPCPSGKRAYRDRHAAKTALHHIQSVPGGLDIKGVYRCRECRCYHLTHHDRSWMAGHRRQTEAVAS
jgi:hypothetical protein